MSKVIVYSTPTCPFCVRTKEYLKSNQISFDDIDVSIDQVKAMEMVKKSGQLGVPVLDIDGVIVIGFDKKKIHGLLNV